MMQYFNFNNLIDKYACEFTVISETETYDAKGDLITSTMESIKKGAIIGISERKIYRSEGVLTEKDKELFMKESLGNIDDTYVVYEGNKYNVEINSQNNHQFTGVWQYTLKWVSVFDQY